MKCKGEQCYSLDSTGFNSSLYLLLVSFFFFFFFLSIAVPSIFYYLEWSLEYCSLYFLQRYLPVFSLSFIKILQSCNHRYAIHIAVSLKSGPGVVFPTIFHLYFKSVAKLAERKLKGKKKKQLTRSIFSWQIKFSWHYILRWGEPTVENSKNP